MANEPVMTLIGNLTDDPNLRFTQSGIAVANFRVAHTPRVLRDEQWVDGEPMFVQCSAWRRLGENVAESLRKGQEVIVQGRFGVNRWVDDEGANREGLGMQVDAVGPSLRWATCQVERNPRQGGGGAADANMAAGNNPWGSAPAAQNDDPWASAPQAGQRRQPEERRPAPSGARSGGGDEFGVGSDEPPF